MFYSDLGLKWRQKRQNIWIKGQFNTIHFAISGVICRAYKSWLSTQTSNIIRDIQSVAPHIMWLTSYFASRKLLRNSKIKGSNLLLKSGAQNLRMPERQNAGPERNGIWYSKMNCLIGGEQGAKEAYRFWPVLTCKDASNTKSSYLFFTWRETRQIPPSFSVAKTGYSSSKMIFN